MSGHETREMAPVTIAPETQAVISDEVMRLMGEGTPEDFKRASSLLAYLGNPNTSMATGTESVAVAEEPTRHMAPVEPAEPTPPSATSVVADEEKSLWKIAKERVSNKLRRTRVGKTAGKFAVAGALGLGVIGGVLISSGDNNEKTPVFGAEPAVAKASATTSTEEADKTKESTVESGWEKDELTPNEENRWLASGFPNIKKAKTPEEAREAANQWLNVMKGDPDTFKFVYDQIHGGDLDKDLLFADNHSTPYAEKRLKELQLTLAMSEIKKGDAAKDVKNPHNTGMDQDGRVVVASNGGVTGDTEAVIIETPTGKVIGVMHRCAQPVVPGLPPGVPPGLTDNPPTIELPPDDNPPGGGFPPDEEYPMHEPADGPPPEAEQHPADPGRTEGYDHGNAEHVVEQQDQEKPGGLDPTQYGTQAGGAGSSPGGGNESVVSDPGASAPANPEYVPGSASEGTGAGTSNPTTTEGSGQVSGPGTNPTAP